MSGTGGGKRGRISTAMMVRARPVRGADQSANRHIEIEATGSTSAGRCGAPRKEDRYADGAGQVFCDRVRVRLWRVRGNRIRTSAAVYFSGSPSAATDLQSINSKYCASNGADARLPEWAPSALPGEPTANRPGFAADHRFDG
jgi:hypothetical protein